MRVSGIYKIQSIIKPDRCYIGSAVYIKSRWAMHLYQLRNNEHASKKLQRHYNKYGESDLVFSFLSGCDKSDLLSQEQFYIDSYAPYFNSRKRASSNLGMKGLWHHSEEWKRKASERLKGNKYTLGYKPSDETKKKLSEALRKRVRKPITEEVKRKISNSLRGRKCTFSEEHRRNLSQSLRGKKRKPLTEEHRKKISEAGKGKIISAEQREKTSKTLRGKKFTEERKMHISEALMGNIPWNKGKKLKIKK